MAEENNASNLATQIITNASETAIRSQSDLSTGQVATEPSAIETPEVVAEGVVEPLSEEDKDAEIEQELTSQEDEVSEVDDKKDKLFASKFAALSRKERASKQREAELEAREKEIEAKLEGFQTVDQLKRDILTNPLKWLQDNDMSFEKLTDMQLNDGNPTADMKISRMEAELTEKFNKKISELEEYYEKDKTEAAEAKHERVINDYLEDLTEYVNTSELEDGSKNYEFIIANDAVDLVYEVVEAHHDAHGVILSNEEAADLVENHLYEEAKKLSALKKMQPKKPVEQPADTKSNTPITLSNDHASETGAPDGRTLSHEESIAKASQLIKWD